MENPHVIDPKQVLISVLSNGIKSSKMNFSYQNRDNINMFADFGHSVQRIAEITPGGILIFFPSYRLMEQCYEQWMNFDVLSKIDSVKQVLKEPKDSS